MKKTQRTLLSILLVLTLLASLPLTVTAQTTVDDNTSENNHPAVASDELMENNTGTVTSNKGTITNNGAPREDGTLSNPSSGIVERNQYPGSIENNYGTVKENVPIDSDIPTISKNYGVVEQNKSCYGAYNGVIKENYGLVGKVVNGELVTSETYGNSGTVKENKNGGVVVNNGHGSVSTNTSNGDGTNPGVINNENGWVSKNTDGGTVVNNKGTVSTNASNGDDTRPGVINNCGTVYINTDGGTVVNNGGTVGENYSKGDGTNPGVINNGGTVEENTGTVVNHSGGTVLRNNSGVIINNGGNVNKNYSTVDNYSGSVNDNQGTVRINGIGGTVTNTTGTVETNYGTVYQDQGTYYGLQGVDEAGTQNYLGSHKSGTELNLDAQAATIQRDGYKLNGYTVWTYDQSSSAADKLAQQTVSDTTRYTINAPTVLKLVWEQIVSVIKPDSGGEGEGSSYNPNYIGLGSVIFINEKGYKVVEIKDDAYVVVTFDALPEEDVADLDALFAKLFTPEQQKLIQNMGQLLDAEDVLTVFGKPGNHPVFEISKELVKR